MGYNLLLALGDFSLVRPVVLKAMNLKFQTLKQDQEKLPKFMIQSKDQILTIDKK